MKQPSLWGPRNPPALASLIASLRGLNKLFTCPIVVAINEKGVLVAVAAGNGPIPSGLPTYGSETLPGSDQKFDATASARRLLAAVRDLEPT